MPLLAARLGVGLGWYFGHGRARLRRASVFIEAGAGVARETVLPLPLRIELMAYLCYLATEDDDLEAAVEAGERARALAAGAEGVPVPQVLRT